MAWTKKQSSWFMSSLDKILKRVNEYDGNIVLSPYSLEKATDRFEYLFNDTQTDMPEDVKIPGLEEFNSWYGTDDERFDDVNRKAEDVFPGNTKTVSFNDAEGTSEIINADCSEHTHGIIDSIVTPGDIKRLHNPEVELNMVGVILNTIFLAKKWAETKKKLDDFTFNGTKVEGMSSEEWVQTMSTSEGSFVKVRFEDGFNFYAFTPRKNKIKLTKDTIHNAIKRISVWEHTLADLYMPNLVMSGDYDDTIFGKGDMVGEVKQKAKLLCTYKGVVAAAATAILCFSSGCSARQVEKVTIRLDKPFYYFIEKQGKVLFIGKMFEAISDQTDTMSVLGTLLDEM